MIKKILYTFFIIAFIILAVLITGGVLVYKALGGAGKKYSVTELKKNFEKKSSQIYELIDYFETIAPQNRFVEIEFKNKNTINRFGAQESDTTNKAIFLEWDLKINSAKSDSLMALVGWNRETLKQLKTKLDAAHCIGIESGEPINIKFQRSGLGMYSFNVFRLALSEDEREHYNDSCRYILVNDKLALEYGGGAVGPQCFPNLK